MQYSLLRENWLPVLYQNGITARVCLLQALKDARSIRQIAATNPMDRVSLLRFLLAVVLWCKSDAKDTPATIDEKRSGIPESWLIRLKGKEDSFDLLGCSTRFYQDLDLHAEPHEVGVSNLLHEFPSGTNIAHFRHIRDDRDGLCLGCCALALIRWSVLASSGTAGRRQSMTAGLHGPTPAYAVQIHSNLFNVFVHELQRLSPVNGDKPAWDGATESSPLGPLKAFTWQSRRILLQESSIREGRCSYCGEESSKIVYKVRFRPGWERPDQPWLGDSHLLRVKTDSGKEITPSWPKPNDALDRHTAMWIDAIQGILNVETDGNVAKFETVLVAAVQALYKHITSLSFVIPPLDEQAKRNARSELDWLRREVLRRVQQLEAPSLVAQPPDRDHNKKSAAWWCALSAQVHAELADAFGQLLRHKSSPQWRASVQRLLARMGENVVVATVSGSPLRRREAAARLREKNRIIGVREQEFAGCGCSFSSRRYGEESSEESEETRMNPTAQYIEQLFNVQEVKRTALRRLAGRSLDASLIGFDLFTGLWWPLRDTSQRPPRREPAWLVAKLFGSFPIPFKPGETPVSSASLPKVLRCCEPNEEKDRIRFRMRFERLLGSPLSSLEPHLRWALGEIARAVSGRVPHARGQVRGVDWVQLLDDLSVWDQGNGHSRKRDIREIWAEQYLA